MMKIYRETPMNIIPKRYLLILGAMKIIALTKTIAPLHRDLLLLGARDLLLLRAMKILALTKTIAPIHRDLLLLGATEIVTTTTIPAR
jgi:hypothetical protein